MNEYTIYSYRGANTNLRYRIYIKKVIYIRYIKLGQEPIVRIFTVTNPPGKGTKNTGRIFS